MSSNGPLNQVDEMFTAIRPKLTESIDRLLNLDDLENIRYSLLSWFQVYINSEDFTLGDSQYRYEQTKFFLELHELLRRDPESIRGDFPDLIAKFDVDLVRQTLIEAFTTRAGSPDETFNEYSPESNQRANEFLLLRCLLEIFN